MNIRAILARKMKKNKTKPQSVEDYTNAVYSPNKYSIYNPKGVSNFINEMGEAEKKGKFKYDSHRVSK